jgi:hypothetical protein
LGVDSLGAAGALSSRIRGLMESRVGRDSSTESVLVWERRETGID